MCSKRLLFMAFVLKVAATAPFTLPTTTKSSREEETAALAYLKTYGYLSEGEENMPHSLRQDPMTNALLEFQAFANLNMTGELDQDTMAAMQRPRCGVQDVFHSSREAGRDKRYSLSRYKWHKPILTYKITKYTNDLSQNTVDAIIREAFDIWEAETNLQFVKKGTQDSNVDIVMFFARGSHGDIGPFDGRGGVLAHAFGPRNGDVHFDDDEYWTQKTIKGTNLFYVAVHEIGHALGLLHSSKSNAIMAPFYRSYDKNLSLNEDDISGIVALYGKKAKSTTSTSMTSTTTTSSTTPSTTPASSTPISTNSSVTPSIDPPRICDDPRIDAITTLANGTTLIFKGQYYYVLNEENNITLSCPRKIRDLHHSGVGGIKSALTSEAGMTTLNAEGGSVYITPSGEVFVQARDNNTYSDASFVRAENGYYYSLKDSKVCWQRRFWFFFTSPSCRLISETWQGLPSNIDAAWQRNDGKIYFFKGASLYKYDDEKNRFLEPNPESLSTWMGCPATDSTDSTDAC